MTPDKDTIAAIEQDARKKQKESRRKAQAKYNATNTTFIGLRFNNNSDWDIVAKLKAVPSKIIYVRRLIRDDIKRTGFDPGPKPKKPGEPPDPADLPPVQPVPTVDLSAEEEARRLLGL